MSDDIKREGGRSYTESLPNVLPLPPSRGERVAEILSSCAELFRNKNSDYREAYLLSTDIMAILLPDKSKVKTRMQQIVYHNMTTIVTKLIRASSLIFDVKDQKVKDESIQDTWRDISIYAAMIAEVCQDAVNINEENKNGTRG